MKCLCAHLFWFQKPHTHIQINSVFIQARFGLAAFTLFHSVWVSFIYLRIRIFFEKVSFQHFMPTTTSKKYRDNTRSRWKAPAAKILAILSCLSIFTRNFGPFQIAYRCTLLLFLCGLWITIVLIKHNRMNLDPNGPCTLYTEPKSTA